MKVAILNDTHCGVRNSSDIFLKYQEKFYEEIHSRYYEVTNEYYAEYEKLRKARKVHKVLDLNEDGN